MTDPDETAAQQPPTMAADAAQQPPTMAANAAQPPTMAADAAAEGETQSINAWSLEDAADEVTPYEDTEVQQRSWKVPAIVAAVAVVIAVGAGVGIWWSMSKQTSAPSGSTTATSSASSPASQTPDQHFIDLLRQQGVARTGTDAQATMSARQICSGLTSGQFTFAQAVTGIEKGSGASNDNATQFAKTAIEVYCPSYQGTQ